ncbi:MAG TPA: hypothetical protein VL854_09390 [Nitrososphaeraceae archaeon]|nr:hypothetical protein [Nitrososphaeraceae archaeon]
MKVYVLGNKTTEFLDPEHLANNNCGAVYVSDGRNFLNLPGGSIFLSTLPYTPSGFS